MWTSLKILIVGLLFSAVSLGAVFAANPQGNPVAPLAAVTCNPNCTGAPNDASHLFFNNDPALNTTSSNILALLGTGITVAPGSLATAVLQGTGNGFLGTIVTNTTGLATAAAQTTGNGSLSTIGANTGAISTATGTTADTAWGGSGTGTLVAISKAQYNQLSSLTTNTTGLATGAKQDTGNASLATIATAQGAQGTGSTFNPPAGGSGILGYLSQITKSLLGTLTVTSTPSSSTPSAPDIATVTTGGTAVNAFSAGHCTRGCLIINPKGATVDLCVNGTGTASGTTTFGALICVPPGSQWAFTARSNAISAVSSDSSHQFGGEGYQ